MRKLFVQMYIDTLTYYFYPRNPIGMLKIVTQKKDGSTKEYGPFGHYCNFEELFTVNGRVIAFLADVAGI